MVHKNVEQNNSQILDCVKNRYQPFYESELDNNDALEILNSMNDLVRLQHSFLDSKKHEICPKKVYNSIVTKYNE